MSGPITTSNAKLTYLGRLQAVTPYIKNATGIGMFRFKDIPILPYPTIAVFNPINSAGTMIVGTAVSGLTQTITANVTTIGSYNISTTANGVTFAATGTFAGTGLQNIVLTATGTLTAVGTHTFALNTSP